MAIPRKPVTRQKSKPMQKKLDISTFIRNKLQKEHPDVFRAIEALPNEQKTKVYDKIQIEIEQETTRHAPWGLRRIARFVYVNVSGKTWLK